MPYLEEVKVRAQNLDPACWISYSGKPATEKRYMEARRNAALTQAQMEYDLRASELKPDTFDAWWTERALDPHVDMNDVYAMAEAAWNAAKESV